MDKARSVEQLVIEFPEFKLILEEHLEFNNELLPHVFIGDCNEYIIEYLKKDETDKLEKFFNFFEIMAIEGDDYTKELLSVTILERLGDDREILNTAYKYMGKETRKASDEIEKGWGRS